VADNIRLGAIKTFYNNRMGLITLEDDVLSVVSQVREISEGRITVELDPERNIYHMIEHCEDGTDRLVFSVSELDGRAVERLRRADSYWRGHRDPYADAEREQDEIFAQQEAASREKLNEHGEEIAFHLREAGIYPRMPLPVSIPKDIHADN
jgi:hypothetical protein